MRGLDAYLTREPDIPEPSPDYEEAYAILEAAGVDTAVIEQVCNIVDRLAMDLAEAKDRECSVCAAKAAAEEQAAWEKAEAEAKYEEFPLCPHGKEFMECNPCLMADDRAYDAERERWR